MIELIELDVALKLDRDLANYSSKTRVIGIFKTGFQVSDFDAWITHLTNEKVKFHGNIVSDDISGNRMAIILDPDGNRIQKFKKNKDYY
ncbi:MAG: hypothetical protein ACI8XB_002378 [Patiriisocius sp.]